MALVACKQAQPAEAPVADTTPEESYFAPLDSVPAPEMAVAEPVAPKPAPARAVQKKEPVKEEVLYISGHGANGRVWGHITMKGDKGYGSVTDEHENALTVTCTRHGEELICYDQNSRQYIFRL